MNILKRINKLRLDRGWSVYRLANEAGLAQSTIINMFNRETLPSIVTLENICTAFGISMSEFFEEDQNTDMTDCNKKSFTILYESLSPAKRQAIYNLMKDLSEEEQR